MTARDGAGGEGPPAPWRNLYGRRHGKKLKPTQRRLLDELLPRLRVPTGGPAAGPDRHPLDLAALFERACPLWLEVGFGGGEHLVAQAVANPGVGLIGCEPFVNGVAMALRRIEEAGVGNVRLHPGDARDLIEILPPAAVGRVFLLYPDPWPAGPRSGPARRPDGCGRSRPRSPQSAATPSPRHSRRARSR